jgi:hypothetical protein
VVGTEEEGKDDIGAGSWGKASAPRSAASAPEEERGGKEERGGGGTGGRPSMAGRRRRRRYSARGQEEGKTLADTMFRELISCVFFQP